MYIIIAFAKEGCCEPHDPNDKIVLPQCNAKAAFTDVSLWLIHN